MPAICDKCKAECIEVNQEGFTPSVQCESCKKWFHFKCADVGKGIERFAFECESCDPTGKTRKPYLEFREKAREKLAVFELLKAQEILVERLEDVQAKIQNLKKTGTKLDFQQCLENLQVDFAKFESNDDQLRRTDVDLSHAYYQNYQTFKNDFGSSIAILESKLVELFPYNFDEREEEKAEDTKDPFKKNENELEIEELLKQIQALKNSNELADKIEKLDLEFQVFKLETAEINANLRRKLNNPEKEEILNTEDLKDILSKITSSKGKNIELAKVPLPTFDGSFDKWKQFKAIASILLGERSIGSTRKLLALQQATIKEPNELIRNLEFTEGNEIEAFKLLVRRYDDLNKNSKNEIKNIVKVEPNKDPAKQVRNLLNTSQNTFFNLKAILKDHERTNALRDKREKIEYSDIQLKAKIADILWNFLISQNFSFSTELKFRDYIEENKIELCSIEQLNKFLEIHDRKLENSVKGFDNMC